MPIDSWERLEEVIELLNTSLPIDISIDLHHAEISRPLPLPLPYEPRIENSSLVPTPSPFLAEVRVSLCIDETLAWLMPVQFCIDQLLTSEEVVRKIVDAFWFLDGWSKAHGHESAEQFRTQAGNPAKSIGSRLIH
jgi:hypothetical protein